MFEIGVFTLLQTFNASVALRRPDDFCAVAPKVTRVRHHEEWRRNASLAAGAAVPARPQWPPEFGVRKCPASPAVQRAFKRESAPKIRQKVKLSVGLASQLASNSREAFLQSLLRQGIDAFAFGLRCNREFFVKLRRNAQIEFA